MTDISGEIHVYRAPPPEDTRQPHLQLVVSPSNLHPTNLDLHRLVGRGRGLSRLTWGSRREHELEGGSRSLEGLQT